MSVLIRGMEMPKGNDAISIIIFPNGKVSLAHDRRFAEYAEAIPVPPHGRLINADALYEDCALDHNYEVAATTTRINEYMQLKIDAAPAIIPGDLATTFQSLAMRRASDGSMPYQRNV